MLEDTAKSLSIHSAGIKMAVTPVRTPHWQKCFSCYSKVKVGHKVNTTYLVSSNHTRPVCSRIILQWSPETSLLPGNDKSQPKRKK